MDKIAAVVVTFNRLELLKKCIHSLEQQTKKLDAIIVVNNGSTDGTQEWLMNKNNIKVITQKNLGGAGGFNTGLRFAFNEGYDWFWIMDDDGLPSTNCLERLNAYSSLGVIDYVAPNLIDNEGVSHFSEMFDKSNLEIINFFGGPFNGILLSKNIILKVGLPIKEFFIWGDETEYKNRILENGFITLTVKHAIHNHKRTGFNFLKVPRVYYYTRNSIFCARLFKGVYRMRMVYRLGVFLLIIKIILYGIISFNYHQLIGCVKGIFDGFRLDVYKMQKDAINNIN